MRPIGQTLYLWRIKKGLTQQAVAKRSGVSRPNISAIEQGGRDLTVETLRRIAGALGVSAGRLVDGLGPGPQRTPENLDRYSLDRIARLAAGERLRATRFEKMTASDLASIMKSKIGRPGLKPPRSRSIRSENEAISRLKTELGPEILANLIQRVEKNLLRDRVPYE